jgi:ferredoxin-like protein FixX
VGIFIEVRVTEDAALDRAVAKRLVEVCPVNIFGEAEDGKLEIIEESVDECTLCELCLDAAAPGAVRVVKLYDKGYTLERRA